MEPFNPLDPTLASNPYPAYADLRKRDRVHPSAMGAHVLTHYEDVRLEPGNLVLGYIGAANRDPSNFDAPDALSFQRDFTRTRPLTFGGGAHMCVGRNLARQEFEVAFTTLLTEHPSVRAVEAGCVFRDTPLMRGLRELPIEW